MLTKPSSKISTSSSHIVFFTQRTQDQVHHIIGGAASFSAPEPLVVKFVVFCAVDGATAPTAAVVTGTRGTKTLSHCQFLCLHQSTFEARSCFFDKLKYTAFLCRG